MESRQLCVRANGMLTLSGIIDGTSGLCSKCPITKMISALQFIHNLVVRVRIEQLETSFISIRKLRTVISSNSSEGSLVL